jgi:hypothetical protein
MQPGGQASEEKLLWPQRCHQMKGVKRKDATKAKLTDMVELVDAETDPDATLRLGL